MPCYNAATFVEEAVNSVMNQTYPDVELIVVDDGSTDGSVGLLQQLATQHSPRLILLYQDHMGPFPARNLGLRHARGGRVAFLDADDYWSPDALEKLATAMDADHADIAYCGWQNVGEGAPGTEPYIPPDYSRMDTAAEFLRSCPWPIHAALVRRDAFDAVKGFSERCFSAMDYDLWLRLYAHTQKLVRVPEVLAFYRWHDKGQISRTKWKQVLDALVVREDFVANHPERFVHLGKQQLLKLTYGTLLKEAYLAYWQRKLTDAQYLLRRSFFKGYWKLADLKYLLPALLPCSVFKFIVHAVDHTRSRMGPAHVDVIKEEVKKSGKWRPIAVTTLTDTTTPPLISIIIPCFNGERFLAESIDSALGQDYPHKEIIVVDDGSTDDSAKVMARYGHLVKIIRQANRGLPAARNAGITAAGGDYFSFLDADDYWAPAFLSKMVEALTESGAGIAYCGWQNIGLPGGRGEPFIPPEYESMLDKIERIIKNPLWPIHAAVVRRDVLESVGGFDIKWKSCEDFAFWIRTATHYPLVRVPELLAYYRFHGNQMSINRVRMAENHFLVQQEFFELYPDVVKNIGAARLREISYGTLLKRGYECYWSRDLGAAREIFRMVMRNGYGNLNDWKYMLPSLLPIWLHRTILTAKEKFYG